MYTPWACIAVTSALPEERKFLVRHNFTTSAYTIQITDGHIVWTEQLDRRRIVGRALDEDTSIDPSEDATQFSLLLDHLRNALSPRKSASRLYILDISRSRLNAVVKSPLPRPLKDLRWPFRLSETPGCTVGTEVAAPLISLAYSRAKQMEYLVQVIQQKDAAIDKLLERIEAAGIDLGVVFPTVAGNKKHRHTFKRAQVLGQIPGLKPFEAHETGSGMPDSQAPIAETIREAMKGINLPNVQDATARLQANFRVRPRQDALQDDYEEDTTMDIDEPIPNRPEVNIANLTRTAPSQDSPPDSDFQRQTTPPNLAQRSRSAYTTTPTKRVRQPSANSPDPYPSPHQAGRSSPIPTQPPPIPYSSKPITPSPGIPATTNTSYSNLNPKNADDDTTDDDDDDLDAPFTAQHSKPTSQTEQSIPARAKHATASPSPSPEANPQSKPTQSTTLQKTKLGGLGGRRALAGKQTSEDAAQQASSSGSRNDEAPHASTNTVSAPAKTKLGRLGGASRLHAGSEASSGAVANGATTNSIGHVVKDEADDDDELYTVSPPRGRSPVVGEARSEERARSTSLERADRKREELKRQLAEQEKKAAAAKKKRRF